MPADCVSNPDDVAAAATLAPLCFVSGGGSTMVSSAGETISFVDHSLDARLRGRSLPHDRVETRSSNPAGSGEVLARCGAVPIWVRRNWTIQGRCRRGPIAGVGGGRASL